MGTYVFKKDSAVANIWLRYVLNGTYKIPEVPSLYNLREIVTELLIDRMGPDKDAEYLNKYFGVPLPEGYTPKTNTDDAHEEENL